MANLCAISNISSWYTETNGAGAVISPQASGAVNISAPAGSSAYVYFPVQVRAGDTVEFSCLVSPSTGSAMIGIIEDSSGSDRFNICVNNTPTLQDMKISYTVRMDSNSTQVVYCKVGVQTADSGSITAMDPRISVNGAIGHPRRVAMCLFSHNQGNNISLSPAYANTGIKSISKKDSNTIDIELDINSNTSPGFQQYPIPSVSIGWATSTNIAVRISNYSAFSSKFSVQFVNTTTGQLAPLSEVFNCTVSFTADIV